MADTAMSGSGTTADDDPPLQTAVWRLRSRACWTDAAALLEHDAATDPAAALQRTALLTERCLYTGQGWTEAEDALRISEAMAQDDAERGPPPANAAISPTPRPCSAYGTGPTRHGWH